MIKPIYKTTHDPGIDAFRAIAVLFVFFHHMYIADTGIGLYDAFFKFFHLYGSLGVDLFFVISGYCIHMAYSNHQKKFVVKNYLIRRWWRIYPPYFFALALAVILNLGTNYFKASQGSPISYQNFGWAPVLTHLFLVHNFSPDTVLAISGPFWTIALEVQFYLLYIIFRPFLFNSKGWLILWSFSFVLHIFAWQMHRNSPAIEWMMPFRYWMEWLLGAFLVYAQSKLSKKTLFQYLALLLSVAMFYVASHFSRIWITWGMTEFIYALGFTFLVFSSALWRNIWISRPLHFIPKIGIFSYSIYLVHFLFLERIRVFILPSIEPAILKCWASIFSGVLCLLICYGFYQICEKPYLDKAASIPKN